METLTRRDLCFGLGVLAAAPAYAQTAAEPTKTGTLGEAKVFPVDQMPLRRLANGGESRDVVRGTLPSGETVAVHESMLPVGSMPTPRHTIQHSELILIREGRVEFQHGDKAEQVDAGGVVYVALGTLHALKNVGDVPAKYFVVAIGGDTKG